MTKNPPVDERKFLELTKNFGKVSKDMGVLGFAQTSSDITEFGHHVGLCWLKLAIQHLADAKASKKQKGARRAVLSRSYYAVYNASKAIRYIVNGSVSLRGDDHQKAVGQAKIQTDSGPHSLGDKVVEQPQGRLGEA